MPQSRGLAEASRSQGWSKLAQPSDRLTTLIVEMFVGGRSQRDIAAALEKALGPCGLSKSAIRPMTDTLSQEDEAWRPRDLRGYAVASLFSDTV